MSIRATSFSAALGKPDPLRESGIRPPNSNRFSALRGRSNSSSGRVPMSPTVKRPFEDTDFPVGKAPRLDSNLVFKELEAVEVKIAKTTEVIAGVRAGMAKGQLDAQIGEFLGGILAALENIAETQTTFSSLLIDSCKFRQVPPAGKVTGGSAQSGPTKPVKPAPTPEENRKKKFVAAVREAEKSVLLFNLDLGQVPIMNTSTISMKVTQDLAAKAALVEGKDTGRPSEEVVTMLDDAVSLVKGMEFYGKVTKPFVNKGKTDDARNGKFCTLPVKLAFRDKETKQKAESLLRSKCKVQCTTPYPLNLRKAIRKAIEEEKGKFKEEFIQVRVDPEAGTLKVSRKTGGKTGGKWFNNYTTIQLDDSVFDLGFQANSQVDQMEIEGGQAL